MEYISHVDGMKGYVKKGMVVVDVVLLYIMYFKL